MKLREINEITKKYQARITTLRRQKDFVQVIGIVVNTLIALTTVMAICERANGIQDFLLFSFVGFVAMLIHSIAHDNTLNGIKRELKEIQECIKSEMKGAFDNVCE